MPSYIGIFTLNVLKNFPVEGLKVPFAVAVLFVVSNGTADTVTSLTPSYPVGTVTFCEEDDGVIVIGGKSSANTKRLFQTAAANCKYAVHIQDASEIPEEFFKLQKVGITAGASTPDEIISCVEIEFKSMI